MSAPTSAPSSEDFDEVTLVDGNNNGSSPRTFGDWTFSLVNSTGANDPKGYVDVTNHASGTTARTHLADDGDDHALGMIGTLNVATAAVIKPTHGGMFHLITFDIENGGGSADYTVIGYRDGIQVISQNFTAALFTQIADSYTINLLDSKWQFIDEFRITRQDGIADIGFYMDNIIVDEGIPPKATVKSFTLHDLSPTNLATVHYLLILNDPVDGFSTSNFSLANSVGYITNAAITGFTSDDDNLNWTIIVSTGGGDGNLILSLVNSTGLSQGISDLPLEGGTFVIDKSPPLVTISDPSSNETKTGPVTYSITYSDENLNETSLTANDITLNKTGSADGTVSVVVDGESNTSYTVTISDITGPGTLGISITKGTANDTAGNQALSAGPSSSFQVGVIPTIIGFPISVDYTIGGGLLLLDTDGSATIENLSTPNGSKLTAFITVNHQSGEDVIGIIENNDLTISNSTDLLYKEETIATISGGTGDKALAISFDTSSATLDAITAVVRALSYENTNTDDTSTAIRSITIILIDANNVQSTPVQVSVNIAKYSGPPILSATGLNSLFIEGSTTDVPLFTGTKIIASEKIMMINLVVTDLKDGDKEVLNISGDSVPLIDGEVITSSSGLTYSVYTLNPHGSIIIKSETGIASDVAENIINGITYINTSSNPALSTRTIAVQNIMDYLQRFSNNSGISSMVAIIKEGQVMPIIVTNGGNDTASINVPENSTTVTTVTALDTNPDAIISYSIMDGDNDDGTSFTINSQTGNLSFNTAPDFENPTDANQDNQYLVTVVADNGTNTTKQIITVSVTDVDEYKPIIHSNGGGSTASISILENTTYVTTVDATDNDGTASIRYSIVDGSDQNLFSIDEDTGELSFDVAPDFEHPTDADGDGAYEVTVRATSGLDSADQEITVTITNVNNNKPVITSNGGGTSAHIDVWSGKTSVTTVTATDADVGDIITYLITGGDDQDLFSVDENTGELSFKVAPDFDNPNNAHKDNMYQVTVGASDGTNTATQRLVVQVLNGATNVPVITSSNVKRVPENATFIINVVATDPNNKALTYSLDGGDDQDLLTIDSTSGMLEFRTPPDFEKPGDSDKNNQYSVIVGASNGVNTATQGFTAIVADTNDNSPVITSESNITLVEGNTFVVTVTASDVDTNTSLTYSLVDSPDIALFTIDNTSGDLSFNTAPVYDNPSDAGGDNVYEVRIQVSDGTSDVTQDITITVTKNTNIGTLVITSNNGGDAATISLAENTTAVTTVHAQYTDDGDHSNQTITYSLGGGVDQDIFSIDGTTGVLTFTTAPDFENPSDADGDNKYEVTVKASDGTNTATQDLTVVVTDVNDNAPVITSNGGGSSATVLVLEGTTIVTTVAASDADAGTTIIYSIAAGIDKDLFSIDESSGDLIFNTAPSYDDPSDANEDNNYEVTVRASDGTNHTDQAITVTVMQNGPPNLTANPLDPTFIIPGPAVHLFTNTAVTVGEDGEKIKSLWLSVSGLSDGAYEILNIDGTAIGIVHGKSGTTVGNSLTYTVTVSGSDAFVKLVSSVGITPDAMVYIVNGMTYTNSSKNPTVEPPRQVKIVYIQDDGGTENGRIDFSDLDIPTTITISALTKLVITSQPQNQTVCSGGIATFNVTATGINLTYQWQYSKDGRTWINLSEKNEPQLTLTVENLNSGNLYHALITSANGNLISNAAILTVQDCPP